MTQSPIHYKTKKLYLMDINLESMARRYGTPTYIYSTKRILEKLRSLQNAFSQKLHVHYSVKANSNRDLLKFLRKQDVGVDVVSGGEIKRALECGFKGKHVIFSGVGKTHEEIELGIKEKIFLFNVESPQELERIGQVAKRLKSSAHVSFRLNPDVNAKTHPYITTGFRENKFGMDQSFLPELLGILKRYKKEIILSGLDFHIGSQLTDLAPFEAALKKSIPIYQNLKSQGFPLKHFDIGGGVGVSYQGQKVININDYGRRLEKLLKPLGCEILCEHGRYLVADAGVLLAKVEYTKKAPDKNFVILNTGMHHLIRPALYSSFHNILPVRQSSAKKFRADVVGPICESSDFLAKDRLLPEPKQGDIWVICDTGAYGFVMASDYNLHAKPKEVLI